MAAQAIFEFGTGGDSAEILERGWGVPERHGRWTIANDATLVLPGVADPAGMVLELELMPFLVADKLLFQDVVCYVNEVRSFSTRLDRAKSIRFTIPASAVASGVVASGAAIRLRLRCPTAAAPRALVGSNDTRMLGVSLRRIVLSDAATVASKALTVSADRPEIAARSAIEAARVPKVAAVTMVYNENVFLPIWLRHYGRQVGLENCIVVDHGSDDGSTTALGAAGRVRLPRSAYDSHQQSRFNSEFCSSLLQYYDYVIYSDVDELLVVDPNIAPSLAAYCSRDLPEAVTAIGLNSIHCYETEPALDLGRPITEQRPYVFPASPMCKPLVTRRTLTWAPGSHAADVPTVFDHLYLFHLRWFDLPQGMARLQKTRSMPWARTDVGQYQRVEDDRLVGQYKRFADLPAVDAMDFDPKAGPVGSYVDEVMASRNEDPKTPFRISLNIWGKQRWRIPPRFVGLF
jgi:hypothetical protein